MLKKPVGKRFRSTFRLSTGFNHFKQDTGIEPVTECALIGLNTDFLNFRVNFRVNYFSFKAVLVRIHTMPSSTK